MILHCVICYADVPNGEGHDLRRVIAWTTDHEQAHRLIAEWRKTIMPKLMEASPFLSNFELHIVPMGELDVLCDQGDLELPEGFEIDGLN